MSVYKLIEMVYFTQYKHATYFYAHHVLNLAAC